METFIYIEKFQFNDLSEKDRFYGHPKEGKVYRAQKDGNMFKIPLESKDRSIGIVLDGLSRSSEFEDDCKWNYSIREVDEKNIGDLDISIDDLEIIAKEWNEAIEDKPKVLAERKSNTDDLKKEIEDKDYSDVFIAMTDNLNDILDNDEEVFYILADVIKTLAYEFKDDISKKIIKSIINDIKTLKRK